MGVDAGSIVLTIVRTLFIGGKCALLVFKSFQVPCRYYRTYDTLLQFEIWFMLCSAVKIMILVPNILITANINYLFTNFVINSLMNNVANFVCHSKAITAMYNQERYSLKLSLLLAFRMFALFMIVMGAMYPELGLSCKGKDPYPKQLAAIMYLEFFNSIVDLIITIYLPKGVTRITEERRKAGSTLGDFDMIDKNAEDDFNDDITELKANLAAAEKDEPKSPSGSKSPVNRKKLWQEPLLDSDDY